MNEWLRRISDRLSDPAVTTTTDMRELKKGMRVVLWADTAFGRHQLADALQFEEVIKHHFVGERVVNGFSILLGDSVILHHRLGFQAGVTIPSGGSLILDMTLFELELTSFDLS